MGSSTSSPIFFTKQFTSAEIAISGTNTSAHGLGRVPKLVQCYLKCITAEYGFAVDDYIDIHPGAFILESDAGNAKGFGIRFDATNVKTNFGDGSACIPYVGAGAGVGNEYVTLTNANWKLIITAWA